MEHPAADAPLGGLADAGLAPVEAPALVEDATQLVLQLWDIRDRICDFPATNPQTMRLRDLDALRRAPERFWVGPKADGTRALLLLGNLAATQEPYSLFADRRGRFFAARAKGRRRLFQGTLVDGEVVREAGELVWLAFDIVALGGEFVADRPFAARLEALRELDIELNLPWRIKEFTPVPRALALLEALRANPAAEGYATDGLVFVDNDAPLRTGRGQACLKWRAHHTVDLQALGPHALGVDYKNQAVEPHGMRLWSARALEPGRIYECSVRLERARVVNNRLEPSQGVLDRVGVCEPLRERPDKARANPEFVLTDTLQTQQEDFGWDAMLELARTVALGAGAPKRPRQE